MAEASYPEDRLYHPEHDWALIDGDIATFGITWFAQDALGEVVFFDPPEVGSGEIVEVNNALGDSPEVINDDPYGGGWMVKVALSDPAELEGLLDRDAYVNSLG